jgi:rhomboid family GlyGly-CTERM serine protease
VTPCRARDAGLAWLALTALLGLSAAGGGLLPHEWLDWQPSLLSAQPWRSLTAIGVHYSAAHLVANLLGVVLVGALGWTAKVSIPMVWAWAMAWPLTHLTLLFQPELAHYGGLSGVLHAGVAVVAVHLVWVGTPAQRFLGAVIAAVLLAKVITESPWGPPVFHAVLGIMVAPLAHAGGAVAGGVCALACAALGSAISHRRRLGA